MKRIVTFLAATTLAATLAGGAWAHDTNGIDRREARQECRIRDGIRDRDLTRGESRRLWRGHRRIHGMERRGWRDGRLSLRERLRLHRALNRQSWRIERFRHNRRSC